MFKYHSDSNSYFDHEQNASWCIGIFISFPIHYNSNCNSDHKPDASLVSVMFEHKVEIHILPNHLASWIESNLGSIEL